MNYNFTSISAPSGSLEPKPVWLFNKRRHSLEIVGLSNYLIEKLEKLRKCKRERERFRDENEERLKDIDTNLLVVSVA